MEQQRQRPRRPLTADWFEAQDEYSFLSGAVAVLVGLGLQSAYPSFAWCVVILLSTLQLRVLEHDEGWRYTSAILFTAVIRSVWGFFLEPPASLFFAITLFTIDNGLRMWSIPSAVFHSVFVGGVVVGYRLASFGWPFAVYLVACTVGLSLLTYVCDREEDHFRDRISLQLLVDVAAHRVAYSQPEFVIGFVVLVSYYAFKALAVRSDPVRGRPVVAAWCAGVALTTSSVPTAERLALWPVAVVLDLLSKMWMDATAGSGEGSVVVAPLSRLQLAVYYVEAIAASLLFSNWD